MDFETCVLPHISECGRDFAAIEELDVSEEKKCILHGPLEKKIKMYVSALTERIIKLG